jgi:hypothetical protein
MDWRLKCLAFQSIARIQGAHGFLQRHVTGRYFLELTDAILSAYSYHVRNFRGGRALEFGAGSNLLCPLLLSKAGATEVLALDIQRGASVERVNHVIGQLRRKVPGDWPEISDLDADLTARYRVRYLAPADARATAVPPACVDFICSTSTLEHIPSQDIVLILREMRRVATATATLSFIIDYHDHYSTSDQSIPTFNFYRYADFVWRLCNPPTHYQNRLRHSDYQRLFADFRTLDDHVVMSTGSNCPARLAKRFAHYSRTDLAALNGFFELSAAERTHDARSLPG